MIVLQYMIKGCSALVIVNHSITIYDQGLFNISHMVYKYQAKRPTTAVYADRIACVY